MTISLSCIYTVPGRCPFKEKGMPLQQRHALTLSASEYRDFWIATRAPCACHVPRHFEHKALSSAQFNTDRQETAMAKRKAIISSDEESEWGGIEQGSSEAEEDLSDGGASPMLLNQVLLSIQPLRR